MRTWGIDGKSIPTNSGVCGGGERKFALPCVVRCQCTHLTEFAAIRQEFPSLTKSCSLLYPAAFLVLSSAYLLLCLKALMVMIKLEYTRYTYQKAHKFNEAKLLKQKAGSVDPPWARAGGAFLVVFLM